MDKVLVLLLAAVTLHASYANASHFMPVSSRIAGGTTATDLQFPYVVSLQALSDLGLDTRGHSCGGALITLQHAVTSASCLYTINAATGAPLRKSPSTYRVFAGAALLTNDASADRWRAIHSFIAHPDYPGPPSFDNDIGVIVLSTPFPSNIGLVPLGLSTTEPVVNTNCTVAGWGATGQATATINNQLRYANKYVYRWDLCSAILNPQPSAPNILPSMLCTGSYSTQIASCVNDTGNALVCGGTLAGVLSYHPPCLIITSWPEVYTRASNYTAWLHSVTSADVVPPTPGLAVVTATPALASTLLLAAVATALVHRT